jgi:hypothetical protein
MTQRKRELLKVSRTKVVVKEVVKEIATEVAQNVVVLDTTNAGELIAELSAVRDAIDAQNTKADEIKAELYKLLGYEFDLATEKWVGDAEVGTIAGNAVVKVATINATNFDKKALITDKPELAEVIKAYTKPAPYKALKIVK